MAIEFIRFYLQEIGGQEVSAWQMALLQFVANALTNAAEVPRPQVTGMGKPRPYSLIYLGVKQTRRKADAYVAE